MSGFLGIINLNKRPIDRSLLQKMTEAIVYRGPDAQEVWIDAHVGFGHTMLRTTWESQTEHQPLTLDGTVWLTADARIDGRSDLTRELESAGRRDVKGANDAELILHAYHAWDEDCVKHLLGDFAFAIWDGHRRRLFCARDHFGVKPFFYARTSNAFVFSNTLDCVRLHPDISTKLNEQAIGDFLLFDLNQDLSTTIFADINRLPPAHTMTLDAGQLSVNRYWTLPKGRDVRYKKTSEYIEHFSDVFKTAVNDRLRTRNVAVSMSGGLDSPSVAAAARELLAEKSEAFDLQSFTIVYDRLIPDRERYYSGLVAKKLGIPINYLVADDYTLYERWEQPEVRGPEPFSRVFSAISADHLREVSKRTRVVLTAYGGDPLFRYCFTPHTRLLLRNGQRVKALKDIWTYVRLDRGVRLIILPRIRRTRKKVETGNPYPTWLNPAFERSLKLRERGEQFNATKFEDHPRGQSYAFMRDIVWPFTFESYDSTVSYLPLETRHPFFDLRLIDYVWSIPGVPWCLDKTILRETMRGILPEQVRRRPKAPLAGNLLLDYLKENPGEVFNHFDIAPTLARYIDIDQFSRIAQSSLYDSTWMNLRPISLNHWLKYLN
jgi:asparagine synthase (glutamine-hydrolysing)